VRATHYAAWWNTRTMVQYFPCGRWASQGSLLRFTTMIELTDCVSCKRSIRAARRKGRTANTQVFDEIPNTERARAYFAKRKP